MCSCYGTGDGDASIGDGGDKGASNKRRNGRKKNEEGRKEEIERKKGKKNGEEKNAHIMKGRCTNKDERCDEWLCEG